MKKSMVTELSYLAYMGEENKKEFLNLLTKQLSDILTMLVRLDPIMSESVLKQILTQVSADELNKQIDILKAHKQDYTNKMMAHLESTGFAFEPEEEEPKDPEETE